MPVPKPKTVLAFDLDGTLVPRNRTEIKPEGLKGLLNQLDAIGHFTVPVTGKPSAYALRILKENELAHRGLIAENAGVFVCPEETEPAVFGAGLEAVTELRRLLGIKSAGVTMVQLGGARYEMVVDPEDVSILTLFTRADAVSHRWKFNQGISTEEVHEKIGKLIKSQGLGRYLDLLSPFPDGGLQVQRRDKLGKTIDKEMLPQVIEALYGASETIPTAMFGDGHNDIPAMRARGVIPLSFSNAEEPVKRFVKSKQGYVSSAEAPSGDGVAEGLEWLADREFFGPDSARVKALVRQAVA